MLGEDGDALDRNDDLNRKSEFSQLANLLGGVACGFGHCCGYCGCGGDCCVQPVADTRL